MQTKEKELGENIQFNLDSKSYKKFLEQVKKIGQKYEAQSNFKKLSEAVVVYGRKQPNMPVKGWTSRVINKSGQVQEVIYADYDAILFSLMKSELEFIQKKYNLSPFYVFKTFETQNEVGLVYGNYIVISCTKKNFQEVSNILENMHIDPAFKSVPKLYYYKTWCLRLGEKSDGKRVKKPAPAFKCIIGDLTKEYAQDVSQAHVEVIEHLYNKVPKIKYTNLDGQHEIWTSQYMTASA